MSYTITKQQDANKFPLTFKIDYQFERQQSSIVVKFYDENVLRCNIEVETDGYHWLQFLLSQEDNAKELVDLPFQEQIKACERLFMPHGIIYIQEDKESAWLMTDSLGDESEMLKMVDIIAKVIEPKFANRERFFEDAKKEEPRQVKHERPSSERTVKEITEEYGLLGQLIFEKFQSYKFEHDFKFRDLDHLLCFMSDIRDHEIWFWQKLRTKVKSLQN